MTPTEALRYLLEQFDFEVHYCQVCGEADPMKDCDSAIWLRKYLAAVEQAQGDDELKAWREMFAAFAASGLPDGWPNPNPKLWPNNWPQDVAMVAFALHQQAQPAPQGQDLPPTIINHPSDKPGERIVGFLVTKNFQHYGNGLSDLTRWFQSVIGQQKAGEQP